MKKVVIVNLEAPYTPSRDMTPDQELDFRLECALMMAKTIKGGGISVASITIDVDKALKIHRRKRWWQFWKSDNRVKEASDAI